MWNLLLMRHAHAADDFPGGDRDRPLREKGKRNAQRMGVWLDQNHLRPDVVYASPAERTRATASKCCKASGVSTNVITLKEDLYGASPEQIRQFVDSLPHKPQTVLVVAHNPGLQLAYESLLEAPAARTKKGKVMPPGTLVHFSVSGDGLQFEQVVFPKTLPRDFPWPDCKGKTRRIRPSYYYQQAAAIPWRRGENGLEVLVISSSGKNHWGIPKGVHDPGLSGAEVARQEALEEAGVRGYVRPQPVGTYRYEKWEAPCEVNVYPMHVSHVVDESTWEESARGRLWLPVDDAAAKVKNRDMAEMIRALPANLAPGG